MYNFFDAVDQIQRTLINYYGINSGSKILKSNRFSIVDQQTQSIRNLLTWMLKGLIKHTFYGIFWIVKQNLHAKLSFLENEIYL